MVDPKRSEKLPSLSEIVAASKRISKVVSRTPLVEAPLLSKRFHRNIFLKLECYQPVRVFKLRGAYNKISQLSTDKIISVSSGNHGIAVAYSSKLLKKKCTIVLPENAVPEKVNAIVECGAEVIKFGRHHDEREAKAQQIVKETGAVYVHPYNDFDVIAGQGTCGLEMLDQLDDFDSVIVPVGGGGLISGISIAIKSTRPSVKVYAVEPQAAPKLQVAMDARKIVAIQPQKTIADGLNATSMGDLTFEACMKFVDGVYIVSDDQILTALNIMIREAHIFPEPSAAASLAALLANHDIEKLGKNVVLVVSGGNVSLKLLSDILSSAT